MFYSLFRSYIYCHKFDAVIALYLCTCPQYSFLHTYLFFPNWGHYMHIRVIRLPYVWFPAIRLPLWEDHILPLCTYCRGSAPSLQSPSWHMSDLLAFACLLGRISLCTHWTRHSIRLEVTVVTSVAAVPPLHCLTTYAPHAHALYIPSHSDARTHCCVVHSPN